MIDYLTGREDFLSPRAESRAIKAIAQTLKNKNWRAELYRLSWFYLMLSEKERLRHD